ncbi:MAG: serine/threonine protein kinase [Chaenotheca gracillima]|nr:MAG: serine/threonine protein kinase [Chaenotheca gracillima]
MPDGQPDFNARLVSTSRWYKQFAERGKRTYLERNVEKVLKHLLESQRRHDEGVRRAGDPASRSRLPKQRSLVMPATLKPTKLRGQVIGEIAKKLSPYDFTLGECDKILRLDVKSLQSKRPQYEIVFRQQEGPIPANTDSTSVRCKCEVTIWHVPKPCPGRTVRNLQLFRDSQLCTIYTRSWDNAIAAVRLDEPFGIRASKLLVPIRRGNRMRAEIGVDYELQISMQPLSLENWPPLPTAHAQLATAIHDSMHAADALLHLTAKMSILPACPPVGNLLQMKCLLSNSREKVDTDLSLEVHAWWTSSYEQAKQTKHIAKGSLPTPDPDPEPWRPERGSTSYVFGTSSTRFRLSGHSCPFCLHRDFHTSENLQLHLVKNHDRFKFRFHQSTRESQGPKWTVTAVDASPTFDRLADDDVDSRKKVDHFVWLRPQDSAFSLPGYLSGESGWLFGALLSRSRRTKSKPLDKSPNPSLEPRKRRREPSITHVDTPPLVASNSDQNQARSPTIDQVNRETPNVEVLPEGCERLPPDSAEISDELPEALTGVNDAQLQVPEQQKDIFSPRDPSPVLEEEEVSSPEARNLQKVPRKRFPVPARPRKGYFFRTTTKRALTEGELVSESDEDGEESWLRMKHLETIDRLSDVTPTQKEFMKKWDSFVIETGIPADRFVKGALLRFTSLHKRWLAQDGMALEFLEFAMDLVRPVLSVSTTDHALESPAASEAGDASNVISSLDECPQVTP